MYDKRGTRQKSGLRHELTIANDRNGQHDYQGASCRDIDGRRGLAWKSGRQNLGGVAVGLKSSFLWLRRPALRGHKLPQGMYPLISLSSLSPFERQHLEKLYYSLTKPSPWHHEKQKRPQEINKGKAASFDEGTTVSRET